MYNLIFGVVNEYNDEDCVPSGYSLRTANSENSAEESLLKQRETIRREKYNVSRYKLYPNPTTECLYVKNTGRAEEVKLVITDITGRILISSTVSFDGNPLKIELPFNSGIYFVNLVNQQGTRLTKKIIIQH